MKMNKSLELHAGDVYTRAMFENFGELLYEAGHFRVEEIDKGKMYCGDATTQRNMTSSAG